MPAAPSERCNRKRTLRSALPARCAQRSTDRRQSWLPNARHGAAWRGYSQASPASPSILAQWDEQSRPSPGPRPADSPGDHHAPITPPATLVPPRCRGKPPFLRIPGTSGNRRSSAARRPSPHKCAVSAAGLSLTPTAQTCCRAKASVFAPISLRITTSNAASASGVSGNAFMATWHGM